VGGRNFRNELLEGNSSWILKSRDTTGKPKACLDLRGDFFNNSGFASIIFKRAGWRGDEELTSSVQKGRINCVTRLE